MLLTPVFICKLILIITCPAGNVDLINKFGTLIVLMKTLLFFGSLLVYFISLKLGTKYITYCLFAMIINDLLPIVQSNPFFAKEEMIIDMQDHILVRKFNFQAHANFIVIVFFMLSIQKLKLKNKNIITVIILVFNVITYSFNKV